MSCWCFVAEDAELQVPPPVGLSDEYAKVQSTVKDEDTSKQAASDGASTAETSASREADISVSTEVKSMVEEKEAPGTGPFEVMLRTKGKKLGLDVDGHFTTARRGVIVKDIKAGAIKDFNDKHPKQAIEIYDELISVDEESGAKEISKAIGSKYLPDIINLTLVRPRKIQVTLVKPGALGMNLDSKAHSVGVVVKDVLQTGLVADWNAGKPAGEQIRPGDRIVENNGKFYEGDKMMKQFKSETTLNLTVLKYD